MKPFDYYIPAVLTVATILLAYALITGPRVEITEPTTLGQFTNTPQPLDILVGQGCVGADGPNQIMVGFEEDEFTQCEAIDVHTVMVIP